MNTKKKLIYKNYVFFECYVFIRDKKSTMFLSNFIYFRVSYNRITNNRLIIHNYQTADEPMAHFRQACLITFMNKDTSIKILSR